VVNYEAATTMFVLRCMGTSLARVVVYFCSAFFSLLTKFSLQMNENDEKCTQIMVADNAPSTNRSRAGDNDGKC
jgi:hypothetical protein